MVTVMKKIYLLMIPVLAASCTQDIVEPVDCNITLDPANTYMTGEPVRFLIDGNVDNILFYSGETGAQYRFKDRYSVPVEQVNSAMLNLDYQARYGYKDGLEVYVSNSFAGLKGDDAEADKATVKAMVDGGMQGWTRLDYEEGASQVWTHQSYEMNAYLDNFTVAFHWKPVRDGKSAQRTYWLSGSLVLDMEGAEPSTMKITELNFTTVMLNDWYSNAYENNGGNGTIQFNKPATADIIFQGCNATLYPESIDGWAISTPSALNRVANDKGTVVKNLQNYMKSYEYVYDKPGNYTASFVCTNANYLGSSRILKELRFSVIDK